MPTYRELAEADAFHRRRMAAALSSGALDDARKEPPGTVRCVIGGLLVAGLCILGATASVVVTGHPSVSRDHDGIHVSW